ncbi:hypothetical protein HN873_059282 [Arachis hypogaea]
MPRCSSIAIPFASLSLAFVVAIPFAYSLAFVIALLLQLLLKKDFNKENMDKLRHGVYEPLDVNLFPPPHLIYAENPSDSGKEAKILQKERGYVMTN